jgi:hypothetical protein
LLLEAFHGGKYSVILDEVIGFLNRLSPSMPHYDPGVDPASDRNEHQESSWGNERPALKTDNSPPSVSRLTRICGSLSVSQQLRASTVRYKDIYIYIYTYKC